MLLHEEDVTKTVGFLSSVSITGFGEELFMIDDDLFVVPFAKAGEYVDEFKKVTSFKMVRNGAFILHVLDKRRPLKWVFESFYKFENFCTAVRLVTGKRCNRIGEMSFDDSRIPVHFYEPFVLNEDSYISHRQWSQVDLEVLKRISNVYRIIEHNTVPDAHHEKNYSRLNNALRFYNIAYDTHFELMKTVLLFIVLESLFSDRKDLSDISYKVRLRAAYICFPEADNKKEREDVFEKIKHGYDIRSRLVHGDNVEREIRKKSKDDVLGEGGLTSYLPLLLDIVNKVFLHILENKENLEFFSKAQDPTADKKFFNDLVL